MLIDFSKWSAAGGLSERSSDDELFSVLQWNGIEVVESSDTWRPTANSPLEAL